MGLFGKILGAAINAIDNLDVIEDRAKKVADVTKKAKSHIDSAIHESNIRSYERWIDTTNEISQKMDGLMWSIEAQSYEQRIVIDENKLVKFECSVPYKYDELYYIGEEYYCAKLYGKCGIIDVEDNIVVPFEYDCIGLLEDSIVPVGKDSKCGYINLNNEVVIDFEFDDALNFSNGLAPVGKVIDGKMKYGYIDTSGEFVIQPKYLSAGPFCNNGLARVAVYENDKDCNLGVIDKDDKTIVNCCNRTIKIEANRILSQDFMHWEEFVCYDLKGVVTGIEEENYASEVEDKDTVLPYFTTESMYGYYIHTDDGDFCKIKPIFQSATDLDDNGYAVVKYNGLYGIIKIDENNN